MRRRGERSCGGPLIILGVAGHRTQDTAKRRAGGRCRRSKYYNVLIEETTRPSPGRITRDRSHKRASNPRIHVAARPKPHGRRSLGLGRRRRDRLNAGKVVVLPSRPLGANRRRRLHRRLRRRLHRRWDGRCRRRRRRGGSGCGAALAALPAAALDAQQLAAVLGCEQLLCQLLVVAPQRH